MNLFERDFGPKHNLECNGVLVEGITNKAYQYGMRIATATRVPSAALWNAGRAPPPLQDAATAPQLLDGQGSMLSHSSHQHLGPQP
ncbi:hypothetical protein HaLaN_08722 [Haematococcus lacustris]|uniref:Uncharacterized protein n=1 Tax=Haematococcus lacustris TaxID=44745 RepID=A0A699Z1Q8_HAELA|nr:hypothetical protein HaLaN_08722 [Haematococcus lacustris]